jgi:WD40 repeat protein
MRFGESTLSAQKFEGARVSQEVMPFAILPGAEQALVIDRDGRLQAHDLRKDQVAHELSIDSSATARVSGIIVSDDGRWAAWRNNEPGVRVTDLTRGKTTMHLPGPPTQSGIWTWKWSRDGRHLALGCADGKVYVWNLEAVAQQLDRSGI